MACPVLVELVESCECSITTPFGCPVLPDVKIMYAALCGLTNEDEQVDPNSSLEMLVAFTTSILLTRLLQVSLC
jgi:hypothetical protein